MASRQTAGIAAARADSTYPIAMNSRLSAVFIALAAAALFGAATPLAKALLGSMSAFIVAGLFYLGSGVGLGIGIVARRLWRSDARPTASHRIQKAELPWLMGAILTSGVAGPALLMLRLASTSAATSSLLLNLESVLTAVIAWVVFRENVDLQVFLGMVAIVAGGVLLSWHPGQVAVPVGALLIVGACLCRAIDNNLTRKVSANDAMVIAWYPPENRRSSERLRFRGRLITVGESGCRWRR